MSIRRSLLASAVVLIACSFPLFLRTFVNDDATYSLIGQKLLQGGVLYREAADNKPPLIYYTFEGVFWLFGRDNVGAVKVLSVAMTIACAVLVAALGRSLFDRRTAALATFLFACASVSGVAEDTTSVNTEIFANVFGLLALYLVVEHRGRSGWALLAAGIAVGIATLFRLPGLGFGVGVAWATAVQLRSGAKVVRALGLVLVGFLAAIAVCLFPLGRAGELGDLWFWAICQNVRYLAAGHGDGITARKLGRVLGTLGSELPVLAAATTGLIAARRARSPEGASVVGVQIVVGLLAYCLGTRFYGHYFLPSIPFLSLLGAWAISRSASGPVQALPTVAALWAAGFLVYNVVRLIGPVAPTEQAALAFVRAHTGPTDEIFRWSGSPVVLFRSGRAFATRFPFNNHLTGRVFGTSHALPSATPASNRTLEDPVAWRQLWSDLASRPPRMVMEDAAEGFEIANYPELAAYLARNYARAAQIGSLAIYLAQ